MNLKEYCENTGKELSSWKFRVNNIIKHFEGLHCDDKEKVTSEINELYILATELDDRIGELEKSCSLSWEPVSKEGYSPHEDLRSGVENIIETSGKGSAYSIPG